MKHGNNYSFFVSIYKRLPEKLKKIIRPTLAAIYFSRKCNYNEFIYISLESKNFNLDFLTYILRHNNLNFDLDLFPESDHFEIIRFLKNQVYFSLSSYLPRDFIFNKEDLMFQKKYDKFLINNVKKIKKHVFQIKRERNIFFYHHQKSSLKFSIIFQVLILSLIE